MNLQKFYTGQAFDAYEYFGAHQDGNGFVFRTYAPGAQRITLVGDFNGWKEHQMMKDAIKTTIKAGIDSIGILVKGLDSNKYSFGDKVKLIIIKQEEE